MWARAVVAWFCLLGSVSCGGAAPAPAAKAPAKPRARVAARPKPPARVPQLDAGQIVLGLRGHEAELHACFDLAGDDAPAFVELGWRVDGEGVVTTTRVRRSTSSAAVAECLSQRLQSARFGRPGSARQASWTFVGGLARFEDAETRRRNRLNARRKNKKANDNEQGIVIERSSPGKLDPEAVEGIVQSGYRLFAHCYRDGLDRDPQLDGAVRLRFVIGSDGQVARVIDGGSDLPDGGVVACIAESFFALRFPKPSGGNVHLRYRMHFDSG